MPLSIMAVYIYIHTKYIYTYICIHSYKIHINANHDQECQISGCIPLNTGWLQPNTSWLQPIEHMRNEIHTISDKWQESVCNGNEWKCL